MNLHQTTGVPDWLEIAPNERNFWQKVAVRTNGFVTPANLMSILGLALVLGGLLLMTADQLVGGVWMIVLGRICDIADGILADRTGTKSPLGEAIDASIDKVCALVLLLVFGFVHIIPWLIVGLIGVQNMTNAIVGIFCKLQKLDAHPSALGKFAALLQWVALFGFALIAAYELQWVSSAYALLAVAMSLSVLATGAYIRAAIRGFKS